MQNDVFEGVAVGWSLHALKYSMMRKQALAASRTGRGAEGANFNLNFRLPSNFKGSPKSRHHLAMSVFTPIVRVLCVCVCV